MLCHVPLIFFFFFFRLKKFSCGLELLQSVFLNNTFRNNGCGWFLQCIRQNNYCIELNRRQLNTDACYSYISIKSTKVRIRNDNASFCPTSSFGCTVIHCEDTNRSIRIVSLSLIRIKNNSMIVCDNNHIL